MLKKLPISYKVISILLKVLIILLASGYIFSRISRQDYIDFGILLNEFGSSSFKIGLLLAVFGLMWLNWLLEARKWQMLIREVETMSLSRSLQAVFCGVTFAIFTPNRVGEFGGRVFLLEKGDRIKGALASFTGSIAQLIITITLGSIGLIIYLQRDKRLAEELTWPVFGVLAALIVSLNVLLVLFYLNSRLFIKLLWKTWLFAKIKRYLLVFRSYTQLFLSRITLLSLARYIIFILQFYLLLLLADVSIPLQQALYLIALMYLVTTVVPSYAISEVTTRSSVSVLLLGEVAGKPLHITAAYFLLWVINLAIPALIGSLFVLNIHFFRNREVNE